MRKFEEYEGRIILDDYIVDKLLDKIKTIWIEKLYDVKILIDTDDKVSDGVTLKSAVMLMMSIYFMHHYFKKKHYMMNKHNAKHLKKMSANN